MIGRIALFVVLTVFGWSSTTVGQTSFEFSDHTLRVPAIPVSTSRTSEWLNRIGTVESYSPGTWQEQAVEAAEGPSAGGGDSGGVGAADATDPTRPVAQLQFQNVFNPESYSSHGYSNVLIVQPVIPIYLKSDFIPYHIVRPTLPIISPSADIDGLPPIRGGIGDLTVIDAFVHPIEKLKTNIGVGPVMIFPTASDDQLGSRDWQLGPAMFVASSAKEGWILGGLLQVPIALDNDAYQVQFQLVANRIFENQSYVGIGDLLWKLQDQNGGYNMPLNFRVGRVITAGKQPINIFIQPQYTPAGMHSGPDSIYGIKLNVTFLLPSAHFGFDKDKADARCR